MTAAQRIAVRQSEIRESINGLLGIAERTDDQQAELHKLTAEGTRLETEYRASVLADGSDPEIREVADDSETRERRDLRRGSSVASFVRSAIDGEPLQGQEAEYRASCDVQPGFMPIDLLMDEPAAGSEHRAITPGVTLPGTTATIAPVLFQSTAASALGVQFPIVQQGETHYPILTTAPTVSRLAMDAEAPASAGAFRLDSRKPGRISGAFEVRVEDLAVMPGLDSSLRASITEVVGQGVDENVFNGEASDANADDAIRGLYAQASDVTAAAAVETYSSGIKRYADLVGGAYARGWRDIRTVIGSDTFSLYASLFPTHGEMSLYDYLAGKLGSITVSDRIPAVASKAQKNIAALTAGRQPIRVPIWRGLQLIRDNITGAKSGKVIVTAVLLLGSPHLPYGANTVKEVHPKLVA